VRTLARAPERAGRAERRTCVRTGPRGRSVDTGPSAGAVLDSADRWGVKRADHDITKATTTTNAAKSAAFTTTRSVNVMVGLQHLLRNAGDRATSARPVVGRSDDANGAR
jgi:hypothetical protein